MPSGVYPRTPNQLKAAVANLALGRSPKARAAATATLRAMAIKPEFRARVSAGTQAAMARPEIRSKHLDALERARSRHGVNFRGGNGQAPGPAVEAAAVRLLPLGFLREFPVPTRGHGTAHRVPTSYKVDFGHPAKRIAVELDGPCHRPTSRKILDRKKTEVLRALGWRVFRVQHR